MCKRASSKTLAPLGVTTRRFGGTAWLRERLLGVALLSAVGCGTTDLDVIERLPLSTANLGAMPPPPVPEPTPLGPVTGPAPGPPVAPSASTGMPGPAVSLPRDAGPQVVPEEAGVDAGACPSAIVPLNLYRIRSYADEQCLAAGPAGFDGYDVVMTDCSSGTALWQLIASTLESYELRNVMFDYNVDIEFGNVAAGSNVVLFAAPGGPSQKFTFAELDDGTVNINPQSAADLCMYGDSTGVWLERCRAETAAQRWHIDPDECTP
jgi:hypothetical protein